MKKTFKTIAAVLLVMVMLVALAACGGNKGGKGGPNGKYYAESMSMEGTTLSLSDLGMSGDSFYIEFNADGTGVMNSMGEVTNFTWEGNKMTADGETTEFQFDGTTVTMEESGMSITFKK